MTTLINNRYQVVENLGDGGMGTVYLVKDTFRNDQTLALKLIQADVLNKRSIAQFKYEFAALSQLRHPNLVDVYDFGALMDASPLGDKGQAYFFTMEYVLGEDWPTVARRYMSANPSDFNWLYDVIVQVCRALQYIHARGFIHYDVKPHNVRVTPAGQVKLMDFGLVGLPHGEGQLSVRGTPEYVAPEIVRGDAVDHRADLYSLGVSLYEIVMGRLPPEVTRTIQDSHSTVIMRRQNDRFVTKPLAMAGSVPQGLQVLIRKLMAKAPEDRYANANEVINAVNAVSGLDYPVDTRETRQGYIQSGAFVGRDLELAHLQGLLARMLRGRGQLVFITGPSGVGKTRLAREARMYAQMQHVRVCEGACYEHIRTPYRPWVSIFRQVIAQVRATEPERLQPFVSPLVQLMPELEDAFGRGFETEKVPGDRQQLLSAAIDFFSLVQQPLMVILEDLHYADVETLGLLDALGTHIGGRKLLVLALFRDDEVDERHPLHGMLRRAHEVSRRELQWTATELSEPYILLRLDLLEEAALAEWIRSMLGLGWNTDVNALPGTLVPWLMTTTGGNARLVKNLMYNLVEEDLLYHDGTAWHIDVDNLADISTDAQDAVRKRLVRLDSDTLNLLCWASVMGHWLDIDYLAEASKLPQARIFPLIARAVQRHILVSIDRAGEPAYRFSDDQVRMAIYETLSVEERERRHEHIGEMLRTHYPDSDVVELMAWHFEQAGRLDLAQRYAKIAGDKARQLYANESAVQHYSRALAFIRGGQVPYTAEVVYTLLSGREEAYRLLGKRQAQREDLEQMARIADEMGDAARQIEVVTRQVTLANQLGNHTEALRAAEAALTLARRLKDRALEADSLDSLGGAHFGLGELSRAYDCHAEALQIARELEDRAREAHNLWHLGSISRILGRLEEAQTHLRASLALYRAGDDRPGEADALNELGNVAQDYAQQRDAYEQSLAIAIEMGDRERQSRTYNNLALTYWSLGLYNRAREHVETAVRIQRELQGRAMLTYFLETLGRVYLALEQYPQAQEAFEEGRALAIDIGSRSSESAYWLGLGRVMLERANPAAARELIKVACEMQDDQRYLGFLSTSLSWLGTAYLSLGEWKQADRYTAEAVACLERAGATEYNPQEVLWLRYQVLKQAPERSAGDPLDDICWQVLQHAYDTMMDGIETLSDEGLRRNYLNKVQVNRDIITEWTRQAVARGDGQLLDDANVLPEMPPIESEESSQLKDKLQRVLDISVRMNETHDATSLLNLVMDQVIELSGAERGFLVLLDENGQFDFRVAIGIEMDALVQERAEVSYSVLETVMQYWKPVLLQDALADARFGKKSSVLELNLRSVLCVPLIAASELIGMIYADNRSVTGRFSQADLDLMMIFANQAATAIENASLYQGLTEANAALENWTRTLEIRVAERTKELQQANSILARRAVQLETVRQVSQHANSILGLDRLLSQVVSLIKAQFGYYFVSVWLINNAKESAVLRAGSGDIGRRMLKNGVTIPLDATSVIAGVCRRGVYRLIDRVDEAWDYLPLEDLPNVASELVLPLRMGENLLGVLEIASDQPSAFTAEDQLLLHGLADQIAIAIRNAQLYEAEQNRRKLAELLEKTGRALSSNLDLHNIPRLILELLNTLVPYKRGLVLLREKRMLRAVAHYGFPDQDRAQQLAVPIRGGDVFQQLAKTRRPVVVDDVTLEPGWEQVQWLPLHRSWLGVPLLSQDKVIGMISLTRPKVAAFNLDDAMWVQAFATQAVIALQNARLYAKITQFNEQLEKRVRERTEELNLAYQNLERLDRTKSDFIEFAAHELRTPLTVLKGYTQLLRRRLTPDASPNLVQLMEGVLAGTDRMTEVVNSMLDVTRIDTQTLQMIQEEVSLSEIIDRVRAGFESTLTARDLTLDCVDIETLPQIQADPDLIHKVFYQLVVNAIKYTPDGGQITITGWSGQDEKRPYVEVVVADTGIGIDPQDLELVFEKFYQSGKIESHSSGRTKFKGGGPGLGLAIARGIVLAHQGQIWVESEACDEETCPGSQFHVRLPVARPPNS